MFFFLQLPSVNISTAILWATFLVLLGIVTLLVFSSMYLRWRNGLVDRKVDEYTNKLFPIILGHLEGDYTEKDILNAFSGKALEYSVFEKTVKELINWMQGEEKEKAKRLLSLDPIFKFQFKRLFKSNEEDLVKACAYFQYIKLVNYKIIKRLRILVMHNNRMISFIAASALMASKDVVHRFFALHQIIRRKRISDMAVVELLYKFKNMEQDQSDEEAKHLHSLIMRDGLSEESLALVILGTSELGYYQLSDTYLSLLQSTRAKWNQPLVKRALILAQGYVGNIDATETVKALLHSSDPALVEACIEVLSIFGGEENEEFLISLLKGGKNHQNEVILNALLSNDVPEDVIINHSKSIDTIELQSLIDGVLMKPMVV